MVGDAENDDEVLAVEEVKTGGMKLSIQIPDLNLEKVTVKDDPDEEEMEMLWEKGEELVGKAKDLMAGLKQRISWSMAQKKSARES